MLSIDNIFTGYLVCKHVDNLLFFLVQKKHKNTFSGVGGKDFLKL